MKISHWRPRRRWDDNFKINCRGMGCKYVKQVEMGQNEVQWGAFLNMVQ